MPDTVSKCQSQVSPNESEYFVHTEVKIHHDKACLVNE